MIYANLNPDQDWRSQTEVLMYILGSHTIPRAGDKIYPRLRYGDGTLGARTCAYSHLLKIDPVFRTAHQYDPETKQVYLLDTDDIAEIARRQGYRDVIPWWVDIGLAYGAECFVGYRVGW